MKKTWWFDEIKYYSWQSLSIDLFLKLYRYLYVFYMSYVHKDIHEWKTNTARQLYIGTREMVYVWTPVVQISTYIENLLSLWNYRLVNFETPAIKNFPPPYPNLSEKVKSKNNRTKFKYNTSLADYTIFAILNALQTSEWVPIPSVTKIRSHMFMYYD